MKVETIGKMLIAAGVIVLLYAMNMDVTMDNSGIVNLHLISERQNTLIFGGFLFLAGIVLFAVFKLKQTKEDAEAADQLRKDRKSAFMLFMTGSDRRPLSLGVRLILGIAFGAYSAFFLAHFALFVNAMLTEEFVPKNKEMIIAGVTAIALIAYAFRKISIKKVLIHFVILAVFATVSIPVRSMLQGMARDSCDVFLDYMRSGGSAEFASKSEAERSRLITDRWRKMAFCANPKLSKW
jgi:hypothetical protein